LSADTAGLPTFVKVSPATSKLAGKLLTVPITRRLGSAGDPDAATVEAMEARLASDAESLTSRVPVVTHLFKLSL
jgi:hypothetical protein